MLESVLFKRGLVREGDPDEGSVYHQKQELLVAQLERVAPGMRSMLEARTPELREQARELLVSVPSPHKPGEMTSPRAAIAHAYLHDLPVEQLIDTSIAIERTDQSTIWVKHPVALRDTSGDLAGLVWTEYDEKGTVKIAHSYFDQTTMTVMNFPEARSVWGAVEATAPGQGGFMSGGLSVNGVQAEKVE